MIRSFVTVLSGTLASRLLGFGRDALIAALLGAGPVADAFLAAFQLVNVVRRLLTEGALNAALVPAWLRIYQQAGTMQAAAFAGRVLGTVSAGLFAATVGLALLMPLVMAILAPGFSGEETLTLAVDDSRLMLPYLAFAGPSTVLLALSSAQRRFALAAFAPLLFNVALIGVTIVLLTQHPDPARAALLLAATIGVAGLLQLAMLARRGRGARIASPVRLAFDAEMRGFFANALPGMVASAGPQLLAVAGAIIASSQPSAVSWLYFANRLIELPLGLVGVAMGTVLVPELTRALHGGNKQALAEVQSHGLELTIGLALPATLGLMILNDPIIRLLFEHGAFTSDDATATAHVLGWLAAALPAQVLTKALQPAFFAREDTQTPLRATLIGCGVAIALAFLLGQRFGVDGIAAGLALGAWANAAVLIRRGTASFGFAISQASRRRLPRMVLAAAIMGAALAAAVQLTSPETTGHLGLAALLAVLIGGAVMLYVGLLSALRVVSWGETVRALRQRPAGDLHL
ncbi:MULTISPECIES: murein biosynthesis integral membrane protein MurJ [Bradyrhizobium]|jgi:putative peptidoglycan lipid II flippase|uniref:murein biosynthesis integral membrane protein MurJ n=2 Tax=Nitrobacteraceae TaxID=41294 RepID=UPI0001519333|nr:MULTISPECIES: murein biosynthesis integral membrane protein MurJ [Bradyrhizobium]ABQ32340.1 putative Virulence factor MviN-like protein [Bradyrhizobium sp. BTAi1]MCL8486456.1 murein biosynthesis integral membrane protein MurJ [Bradyrhizobium denitrificans]RTL99198.1 MAG: murein biosynthesis integral membrane protein MurJ [Bradyrhizobiaceae bacterium]